MCFDATTFFELFHRYRIRNKGFITESSKCFLFNRLNSFFTRLHRPKARIDFSLDDFFGDDGFCVNTMHIIPVWMLFPLVTLF